MFNPNNNSIHVFLLGAGRERDARRKKKRGGDGGSSSNSNSNRTRNYSFFFSFFSCPISIEVIYCGMDVHLKTRLLPDIKLPPFNIYLIFDELYTTSNWCIPGSPPPPPPPIKESKSMGKKVWFELWPEIGFVNWILDIDCFILFCFVLFCLNRSWILNTRCQ